ncbi:hypothetical protein C2845_PM09G16190 [Panicum miliaceum]|uniref:DUF4220 domain-containing protein n=1 Tax=Panicum miliaceum TaxID=4540 RepID=A0A3L6S261_PANMI|nr:hypothetical protein C2845_PM09G16190 [Panicum miliaceum]
MTELYSSCETNNEITLAHVIMTWHIATWHFEISEANRTFAVEAANRLVATSLSKYCAYLVAFAPELVPGSPIETQSMLDELVNDARKALRGTSDIYKRLQELQNEGTESLIFAESAILGMKLEIMEEVTRWNLLADFWAELMLYIAPSDNVAGHIEHLAQGGESVTHVWALLMHAGILERPAAASAI